MLTVEKREHSPCPCVNYKRNCDADLPAQALVRICIWGGSRMEYWKVDGLFFECREVGGYVWIMEEVMFRRVAAGAWR